MGQDGAPRSVRRRVLRLALGAGGAFVLGAWLAPGAAAFHSRTMARGMTGPDVAELQVRVAGWYDNCIGVPCQTHFHIDGKFGPKTERAVRNFQAAYGLAVDGVAGPQTNGRLHALESPDGSTVSFDWSEFTEKGGECATPNQGTFAGGSVPAEVVRQNVRWLMWRLEAVRHKLGDQNMYVTSGFRSEEKQRCLNGRNPSTTARPGRSQHNYGMARDGLTAGVTLGQERSVAKTSEVHGIICYTSRFNHLDLRLDNRASNGGGRFQWPRTNGQGQDLTESGDLCHGGHASPPSTGRYGPAATLRLPEVPDPLAPTDAEGALAEALGDTLLVADEICLDPALQGVCELVEEIHDAAG